MRCQSCQNIPLSVFVNPGAYDHSDSYELLSSSAAAGCDLCLLLRRYIDDELDSRTAEYADGVRRSSMKIYLEHVSYGSIRSIQCKWATGNFIFPELLCYSAQLPLKGSNWVWQRPVNRSLALHAETNSPECFNLARGWIQTCLKDHPVCQGASNGWLPTRLIEVGSAEQQPRLRIASEHISSTRDNPYLTLSHCWGNPPHAEQHMTKITTLSERLEKIPFESLPKTFQDAIVITRNLKVPYLWIDTFCILQDSKEDWESEAASMAKVYSSSYCTIAASSSDNWQGGCFVPRDRMKTLSCNLFWGKGESELADEDIFMTIFLPLPDDTLKTCPLNRRAWTLQERRLSRRILHYTDIDLKWECHSWAAGESNPIGRPRIPMQGHNAFGHIENPYERWRIIIKEYSKRQLTYWNDRLAAISGLASQSEMALNGEQYLAGAWRGDLVKDLLWYRPVWVEPFTQHSEYLAPTWSWASRLGTVETPVFMNILGEALIDDRSGPEILAAETTLAGQDPFGQISSGSLHLLAVVRMAIVKIERARPPGVDFAFPLFEEDTTRVCGKFTPDCEAEPSSELIYLIRMATVTWPERDKGQSLVIGVRPTGSAKEEYKRYGMGKISNIHWFDGCAERAIILV